MYEALIPTQEVLRAWPQRWRYPGLLKAIETSDEVGVDQAIASVLDGFADPLATPMDAVRHLSDHGEFALAEELLTDTRMFGTLPTDEYNRLHEHVDQARRVAVVDLDRAKRELTQRAARCNAALPPLTALDDLVRSSRTAADAKLSELNAAIDDAELALVTNLRNDLDRNWPDAPPSWRASVQACIDALEFAVARRQLADGPGIDLIAGPAGVPRPRPDRWPWSDRPFDEVFGWYRGEPAPASFGQWAPEQGDADATRLVTALAELIQGMTHNTVWAFAGALDSLFGSEEVGHAVEPVGSGYRTVLSFLGDPRLPHLTLPGRVPLWVGPADWMPPFDERAVSIWFRPDDRAPAAIPPRVAVIRPETLLVLIAPDRDGHPTDRSTRRINLLRTLCQKLDPGDVLPVHETATNTNPAGLSDDLAWAFDLFGMRTDAVVLDALRYDTGDHPAALWTAVRTIVSDPEQRLKFNHEDLKNWRYDENARASVRQVVLAPLDNDPAAALTTCVALEAYGSEPRPAEFTDVELLEWIRSFADPEGLSAELESMLDMPSLLFRSIVTGLFERLQDGRYQLIRPGLVALISGAGVPELIRGKLQQLRREGGLIVSRATVNVLLAQQRAIGHLIGNRLYDTRSVLTTLRRDPDVLVRERAEQVSGHLEPVDLALRELSSPDVSRLLTPETVDVIELADELRRQHEVETGGEVIVEMTSASNRSFRPVVRVRRTLLRLAVENLLLNATQSIMDSSNEGAAPRGTVRITTEVVGVGAERQVVIDVEDDGPGLSDADRSRVNAGVPFTTRKGGQGLGLVHAAESLGLDHGSLTAMPHPAARLGGAHFRIVLPYYPVE